MTDLNAAEFFRSIGMPEAERYVVPAGFKNIVEKILPILGAIEFVEDEPEEKEARIYFYEKEFGDHVFPFTKMVHSLSRSEEEISFPVAVRLYGFSNTLAYLCGIRLWEALNDSLFAWDPQTLQPKADAKLMTRYAIRALHELGEDSRYRRSAFVSGLAFDTIAIVNAKEKKSWYAKVDRWMDEMFAASLKTAQIAMKVGRQQKDLSLESHLVEAVFLRKVGRLALATFERGYLELSQTLEKERVPRKLWGIAERHFCGVSSNRVSALMAQFLPGVSKISLALLCYDFPFLLAAPEEKDLRDLAQICDLASRQAGEDDSQ